MHFDKKARITEAIPFVFITTFLLLPFSAKAANVTALLVFVLWVAEGGLGEKWAEIRSNPAAWIPLLYVSFMCIGLLWTSDLRWGLHVISKSYRIPLIPVFLSVAGRTPWVFRRGMCAFLAAAAGTAVVSLGVAAGWIPPFGHAAPGDPSPFVYHVSYAPELAWAAYVAFAAALFDSTFSRHWKIALCGTGLLVLVCLFANIGVAGYAAALMLFGLLILQWKKKILLPMLVVLVLAGSAYWFSPTVHRRVDQNIQEVQNVLTGRASQENLLDGQVENTSLGPRLIFWGNTWQIIKDHLFFGAGIGDFPVEYEKVRQKRTPNHWEEVNNPHNMYLMVWVQSGLIGLIIFLGIFVSLFVQNLHRTGVEAKLTTGLICFMLLIMMSDAYMQLNNTSLLFALFAGLSCSSKKEMIS